MLACATSKIGKLARLRTPDARIDVLDEHSTGLAAVVFPQLGIAVSVGGLEKTQRR